MGCRGKSCQEGGGTSACSPTSPCPRPRPHSPPEGRGKAGKSLILPRAGKPTSAPAQEAQERDKGQLSKGQQLPRPHTEGSRRPGMALDKVPCRVGVVGYGRLGESLNILGFLPQAPSQSHHKHVCHLCPPTQYLPNQPGSLSPSLVSVPIWASTTAL